MLHYGYIMNSISSERNYLYFGIFFVGFFVFVGLALLSEKQTYPETDSSVTLTIKTEQNTYLAEIPKQELFSKETTVLFSPLENNQNTQPLQCKINCIK